MVVIGNEWDALLAEEFDKSYYQQLRAFLKKEYAAHTVYPNMYQIFSALQLTPYSRVKVVILGQDPYHEPGQAEGLAFSVPEGIKPPPSLVNIFKELHTDLGLPIPLSGSLRAWAEEGVLLLNTTLTVREHQAGSHRGHGWEIFTDRIIELLSQREEPVVFILWGRNARDKKELIDTSRHLVLEGPHPSPLSAHRGFFGGRYFSQANNFLKDPVDWALEK